MAVLHVFLSVTLGVLLLCLACLIPTERIEEHVRESALETIAEEGAYPVITKIATSTLDNYTDSLMLSEAVYSGPENALEKAMLAPRKDAEPNGFPNHALVIWAETENDSEIETSSYYRHYWHGFLLLLKPLLLFLDYAQIRVLNGIAQTALTLAIAMLLWRRGKKAFILPYLLSIAMLMPLAMAKSLQFSACFYVFSLAGIAVLLHKKRERTWLIFLYAGIGTAFFDYLTYPVSTFGVPAILALILSADQDQGKLAGRLLGFLLAWSAGYGLMWGGKLVAGTLLLGENFLGSSAEHMAFWFRNEHWYSIGHVIYINIRDYVYTPVSLLSFALAVYLLIRTLREKAFRWNTILPWLIPMLLPFCWYIFLLNPSGAHHFFTNKACVVVAFGGMAILAKMRENKWHGRRNSES